jgi:hypothetical protein
VTSFVYDRVYFFSTIVFIYKKKITLKTELCPSYDACICVYENTEELKGLVSSKIVKYLKFKFP